MTLVIDFWQTRVGPSVDFLNLVNVHRTWPPLHRHPSSCQLTLNRPSPMEPPGIFDIVSDWTSQAMLQAVKLPGLLYPSAI